MFGKDSKRDIAESIKLIESAVKKEHSFRKHEDRQVLNFALEEAKACADFISDYAVEDSLYIHYSKKEILSKIVKELNHFVSLCRYYHNYFSFDHKILLESISKIKSLLEEYSKEGSLYVFRHCEKAKRTDAKGRVYDGIATPAIKKEAMKRAREIIDEILISPKKVRIILYHSEERRTKTFGEIILREIKHHLDFCKEKIEIINKGYDPRIRFGYFTKESLAELMPTFKEKGDFYTFTSWYLGANEFKSFKLQPKPGEIIAGIDSFVRENYNLALEKEHYNIIIAITHSWIIDAYLVYKIPGLYNQINHIIKTTSFFKPECREMNYLGKWVGL